VEGDRGSPSSVVASSGCGGGFRSTPEPAVCVAGGVPSWASVGHEFDFRDPFTPGFGSIKAH